MKQKKELEKILNSYGKLAIAFSGGTDSTLLAKVAKDVLGQDVFLVHILSPFTTGKERQFAERWALNENLDIKILTIDPLKEKDICCNSPKRCYFCKKLIMSLVITEAAAKSFDIIADGTNVDDFSDDRPGLQATEELGIKHPLADAGFDKRLIRLLARHYQLENWRTPAAACLATRIPFNTELNKKDLLMISQAEDWLDRNGFSGCRVRLIKHAAKIEVNPIHFHLLMKKRELITKTLKSFGFKQIFLDLEGYRQGATKDN